MNTTQITGANLSFTEVAKLFRQEHWVTLQYNTIKGYNSILNQANSYFENVLIEEISSKNIETYLTDYSLINYKGILPAAKTVRNKLLVLNMLFNFACKEGILQCNPAQFVRIPRNLIKNERLFPSDTDINAIQNNIDAPFGNFFYLALYTGCRRGELLALQWKDIDFNLRYISITKSVYYKGNQPFIKEPKTTRGTRKVILLDKAYNLLLSKKGNPNDYLFSDKIGNLLTYKAVENLIKQYREITKSNIGAHSLRHYFCSACFECGLDVKVTQLLMGHSDVSTTLNIYTHIKDDLLLKEATKLNNINF